MYTSKILEKTIVDTIFYEAFSSIVIIPPLHTAQRVNTQTPLIGLISILFASLGK